MQEDNLKDDVLLIADVGRSAQGWLSFMLSYILNARYVEPYALMAGSTYTQSSIIKENTSGRLPGRAPTRYAVVAKTHEFPSSQFNLTRSVIYLTRDPRDVAVSMYYLNRNRWNSGQRGFGFFLQTRRGAGDYMLGKRWASHVRAWLAITPFHVRYEDLRHDTAGTLVRILEHLSVEASPEIIQEAIDVFSYENTYGRKRGVEVVTDGEARKGIIGDYRNHFTEFSNKMFWRVCGREAELAGYRLDGTTTVEPTA